MSLYPLLASQAGVLLENLENPSINYYNLATITNIPASISKAKLTAALQKTIDSLPVLRNHFVRYSNGFIQQESIYDMKLNIKIHKLRYIEMMPYIHNTFMAPFNLLGSEPLARFELITTEAGTFLLTNIHHSIVDAYSYSTVFFNNLLANIYNEKPVIEEELSIYYASLAEDMAFNSEAYHTAKYYFLKKFADSSFFTLQETTNDDSNALIIDRCGIERKKCDRFCREQDIRVNILFQGALSCLLSALAGQERICYTSEYHGRNSTKLKTTFGMLEKTLPVAVEAKADMAIIKFLQNLQSEMKEITRQSLYPFGHFYYDTHHDAGLTFNFRAIDSIAAKQKFYLEEKPLQYMWLYSQNGRSYMIVNIDFAPNGDYSIFTEYNASLLKQDTLNQLTYSMAKIVNYMIKHPFNKIKQLEQDIPEIQQLKELRHIVHFA